MEVTASTSSTTAVLDAYRTCVHAMTKAVGATHAERACAHVKVELLRCVAEARCPEATEAVVALCGGLDVAAVGGTTSRRACKVARVALDECMNDSVELG